MVCLRCSVPRPPQPIWTMLSFSLGNLRRAKAGAGRRLAAETAPAARAARLMKVRRFRLLFILMAFLICRRSMAAKGCKIRRREKIIASMQLGRRRGGFHLSKNAGAVVQRQ